MKAQLDGIYSPTLPAGYSQLPKDPTDCWIVINADIGGGGLGLECFTFYVTTPKFLSKSLDRDGFQLGRGLVILNEFDWNIVENAVRAVCSKIEADTWSQVAEILSRYFYYEFENDS